LNLIERVQKFIQSHKMFTKRDRILLSFSGGPDSTFLAIALRELGYNITLFYLNHMLREDSHLEEKHVDNFSKTFKIPLIKKSFDVKAFVEKTGMGIEEGARKIRKKLLMKEYKNGFTAIATGHTLDDNIENFLIRLFRGSGFGLKSMKPVDKPFVRPLLGLRRSEIISFLEQRDIDYYTDPTNMKLDFLRNKIRHILIPEIEEISPIGLSGIVRSIENLQDIEDALNQLISIRGLKIYPTHLEFNPSTFLKLPDAMRFIFLRKLLEMSGRELEIRRNQIKSFPGRVEMKSHVVSITEKWGVVLKKIKTDPVLIEKPGAYRFGDFEFTIGIKNLKKHIDFSRKMEYFDMDDVHFPLGVRTRKRGERLIPFGRRRDRKLKDLFIDAQVPDVLRDVWPVVYDKKGILFVPMVVRAERGRIRKTTERVLMIKYRRLRINER